MSSNLLESPHDGSIEDTELAGLAVTAYVADTDGATVVEIETHRQPVNERVRVYVDGISVK